MYLKQIIGHSLLAPRPVDFLSLEVCTFPVNLLALHAWVIVWDLLLSLEVRIRMVSAIGIVINITVGVLDGLEGLKLGLRVVVVHYWSLVVVVTRLLQPRGLIRVVIKGF